MRKYKPYEFSRDDAFRFAREVGIRTWQRGDELHFKTCPYCHGEGRDNEQTFAISLRTGQFKCLRSSCGAEGNMIRLSKDFHFSLGNEADEVYIPKRRFRTFKTPDKPIEPKGRAVEYLSTRGISEGTVRRYEVTAHAKNPAWLVFPFFDDRGTLAYIKYRNTEFRKGGGGSKEWAEKGGKPILFGMKQCNPEIKTLVICEGQIDSLSVAEAGIANAVSVPNGAKGFTWVPYCWEFVTRHDEIVVFGDHEGDKVTLLDELRQRFKMRIRCVTAECYGDCKDANDILRKYGPERVRRCVEEARNIPVSRVISLADVEDINPYDIPKLPTGIRELDKLLCGGIPPGVTLITGKPGEGKSTLTSQILLSAADSGHRCFAYSGELPNHMFKSWMTLQAAGPRHIYKYETRTGAEGYTMSLENRAAISEWFRGRVDIYDAGFIGDGEEGASVLNVTEEMVARNGADVILIDNLMTALDLEGDRAGDKFERQSQFMKRLTRIALVHGVYIILVAHMRKNNYSRNGNDEVSGTGDIANLASVTIMYEKNAEAGEGRRLLKVWKNRLFGRVNTEGWVMEYDERSKRIYGQVDDLNREYGWLLNRGFERLEGDFPFPEGLPGGQDT